MSIPEDSDRFYKMSGIFPGDRSDVASRYNQRFNELCKKNPNVSLVVPLSGSNSNLGESMVNGQYFGNSSNRGLANGTLTTQQFYQGPSNQGPSQFQAENVRSKQLCAEGSSTCASESGASVFKKPLGLPVKKLSFRSHFQRRLESQVKYLCALADKPTLKFVVTAIETLTHSVMDPPIDRPVSPVSLMDHVSTLVKEEYISKRVPKSICGSSIMSDQTSNIDQYAEISIRSDKPHLSSVYSVSEVRVNVQDISQSTSYRHMIRPPQDVIGSVYSSDGRAGVSSNRPEQDISHQQQRSNTSTAAHAQNRGRPPFGRELMETLTETESTFNYLNDSEMAQMRDEAAARQESMSRGKVDPKKSCKTFSKPTPKPNPSSKLNKITKASAANNKKPVNQQSKELVPDSEKRDFDVSNKNISLLNGTVAGVSRRGRPLKPSVKYWSSKAGELSVNEPDESPLNESMTLRNKKVVDKKTPPIRTSKTPLASVQENEVSKTSLIKNPRGKPSGKENASEKKKPVKKQTEKKNTLSTGKRNKKNDEALKQNTEKKERKPTKRKSKETNNLTPKKKKIEDPVDNAPSDNEDDLFGGVSYKKTTHQNFKMVLSPSGGLMSAKKAAGAAQGKATPPCKAIGELMMNESILSAMSAAKEAPKQHEAIKRVIKKMERDKIKPPTQPVKAKTHANKTKTENSHLNLMEAVKSTYSVNNPMCSATLTVFRGTDHDSDSSDVDQDDDDLM